MDSSCLYSYITFIFSIVYIHIPHFLFIYNFRLIETLTVWLVQITTSDSH